MNSEDDIFGFKANARYCNKKMARYHKLEVGTVEVYVFEDGIFPTKVSRIFSDFGASFITKEHTQHGGKEKVDVGFNYAMVVVDGKNILIDTGVGSGYLLESMKMAGFEASDIDGIIISHADGDHVGGLGLFPNAKIYIPKPAYQLWTSQAGVKAMNEEFERTMSKIYPPKKLIQSLQARINYSKEVLPSIQDRIILIEENQEFIKYLTTHHTPAHRSDHYAIVLDTGEDRFIISADAIRFPFQMNHPEVYSNFESNPSMMKSSIEKLKQAAKGKAMIFGTHATWPGFFSYEASAD